MKNSSTSLDAFSTPNIPPLAVLETDINSECVCGICHVVYHSGILETAECLCVCACARVCVCTCLRACVCLRVCVSACLCVCVCMCMHLCMHPCVCLCVYTYIH